MLIGERFHKPYVQICTDIGNIIISYHIISYHIISYHIISYLIYDMICYDIILYYSQTCQKLQRLQYCGIYVVYGIWTLKLLQRSG